MQLSMRGESSVNRDMDRAVRRAVWTWTFLLACSPKTTHTTPPKVADVVVDTPSAPADRAASDPPVDAIAEGDGPPPATPEESSDELAAHPKRSSEPPKVDPAAVPAFAKIDFRVRTLGKRRARIERLGTLYSPAALTPLSPPSDRGVMLEVPVIDGDEAGTPRRPRVLCEEDEVRVGVAIDAGSLGVSPRADVFVHPYAAHDQDVKTKTPGLRLAGGTRVERLGSDDGLTKVHYDGLFLDATGWVDDDELDVVYVPEELPDDDRRNGEMVTSADVLDAPHGEVIGQIAKDPTVANRLFVFRFGPARDDYTLVRFHDYDAFIVGWVPTTAIDPFPTKRLRGGGGGGGSGTGTFGDLVALARGTYLVPVGSSEVVGVVTADHEAACAADCDGPLPQVRVWVCGSAMILRAVTPDQVTRGT